MDHFVKRNHSAPQGFFSAEAAGLQWLAVDGGVRCARVIAHDATSLTLQRLQSVAPSTRAASEFGRALAVTHDAGASAFGAGPDGYHGAGFFGPMSEPLPMSLTHHDSWGTFYADERLEPMGGLAGRQLDASTRRGLDEVAAWCRAGRFDDRDGPARLHGDLWSGNVMWTADGVVLIDPAAHGGHRETDLAMLALFGCSHLGEMLTAYESVHPLQDGWQNRVGLHQLYPLLAHVVLFGGSYAAHVAAVVTKLLAAIS